MNYLKDLFETVYLADIIERHKIRNENEMRELVLTMASSIGTPCNPTKLSNTFKSDEKSGDRQSDYIQLSHLLVGIFPLEQGDTL